MANRTTCTPKKIEAFLEALDEGAGVSDACRIAGIARRSVYEWRAGDPEFRTAWDKAIERSADSLEAEAVRRARDGVDEPVFYKGEACGVVRKYSDTLLIFMLKARRPERFRENVMVSADDGQMDALLDAIKRS